MNPTQAMVAAQAEAAQKAPAPALASSADFRYSASVALNKPSARTVAQAIANRFNLRLVFAMPEFKLKGPVTLLAESAEQDVMLLQKAIGRFGPAVLEVSAAENVLRVVPRHGAPMLIEEPVLQATAASVVAGGQAVPAGAEPAKESVPAPLVLTLNEAEPLEDALARFARAQGYTLEWKVDGGFEASRAMHFSGSSVAQVLSEVLPNLGLSADVYTRDKHIVVRPADVAWDR
jgi:hypothetical protein